MKTILIDFDGVIHSYKSGWKGITSIPDGPVFGIKEMIDELREQDYIVMIFSTRCCEEKGIEAMKGWLNQYKIKVDGFTAVKVPAFLTIDDRAICFSGDPGKTLEEIRRFKTWQN